MMASVKRIAIAAGAILSIGVMATNAQAAIAYVGRGTAATSGSALSDWITNVTGTYSYYYETSSATNTATTVPLPSGTLSAVASAGAIAVTGNTLSNTNQGSLSGASVMAALTARSITLSSFSPSVTAFGFYLQNLVTPQNNPIVITMTDTSGNVTTITVASATDSVTVSGATQTFTSLGEEATTGTGNDFHLSSTLGGEFIGFSGVTGGIASIVIGGATSTRVEIGDFFGVPEPASMALLGAGLAGLGLARRRRKSA